MTFAVQFGCFNFLIGGWQPLETETEVHVNVPLWMRVHVAVRTHIARLFVLCPTTSVVFREPLRESLVRVEVTRLQNTHEYILNVISYECLPISRA